MNNDTYTTFNVFKYLTYNDKVHYSITSTINKRLFENYPNHINDDKRFILLPDKKTESDHRIELLSNCIAYGCVISGILLFILVKYCFNILFG